MPKIKAAVAYEFGKPLQVEDVILRSPINNEVEVTLGQSLFATLISLTWREHGVVYRQFMGMKHPVKSVTSEIMLGLAIGDRVVVTLFDPVEIVRIVNKANQQSA